MSAVFKKLNLKDQKEILVLNPPESFESELAALEGVKVHRDLDAVQEVDFWLAFVSKQDEVDALGSALSKTRGDAVVWFAYPKGSSKKYKSEINRDRGWAAVGEAGFEPVRQVAIDEDWSASRFRRVEYIKTMQRSQDQALSEAGRKRLEKKD